MTEPDPVPMEMVVGYMGGPRRPFTLRLLIKSLVPPANEPEMPPSIFESYYQGDILKGAALLAKGLGYRSVQVIYDGRELITSPVNVVQGCEETRR